jgi:hypothetical protein
MNSSIATHFARFVGLVLVQGLLLKQVSLSVGSYFNVIIYPLFILFLPMLTATPFLVLLGFLVGITVDLFYGTPGIHASAGAFAGLIRPIVFKTFAPSGVFSGKEPIFSPINVGWQTFLQGAASFFVLHLFWYFSVDSFTFVYFGTVTLKTLCAWGLSMVAVMLYAVLFNPKY